MKKLISGILCLFLIFSVSIPGFAVEIDSGDSQTTDTLVTYGPSSGYTVVIPESIVIPYSQGKGDSTTITVSASDVMINHGSTLDISISGQSNNKWLLVDSKNNNNNIEYIIGTTAADDDVIEDSTILTVPAGDYWNGTKSTTLHLTVNENVQNTGSYSDTITFTVGIGGASPVKFGELYKYIDGSNYITLTMYRDGSAVLTDSESGTINIPAGEGLIYEGNNIYAWDQEGNVLLGTVSSDGKTVDLSESLGIILTLEEIDIPLKFGEVYGYVDGEDYIAIIPYRDGSLMMVNSSTNEVINVSSENGFVYENNKIYVWDPDFDVYDLVGVVSDDGKVIDATDYWGFKLTLDGIETVTPEFGRYYYDSEDSDSYGLAFFEDGSLAWVYAGADYYPKDSVKYVGDMVILFGAESGVRVQDLERMKTDIKLIVEKNAVYNETKTELWGYSYPGDTWMVDFVIPDTVTTLKACAFNSRPGLRTVVIPTSVTYIGPNMFTGSNNLETIYYEGTQEQWEQIDGSDTVSHNIVFMG